MLSWLFERFASAEPAMIWRDRAYSYAWLRDRIEACLLQLDRDAIAPGTVVALEGDYSPDTVALLLALVHSRCIVVPLSSAVEASKPSFREIAEVQATYTIPSDAASDDALAPAVRTSAQIDHPLTGSLIVEGHPGLVLFSSGSTGQPKAVLHDFAKLLEKFKTPRHSLRTITFLLLDHIGGINTLLYVLSNAGTIVSVSDRTAEAVCNAIEKHRVELLPTTPTFLNLLLLSEAYRSYDLSSLKQITYGTEPMPQSTLQRIHAILPNVKLLQTYGMSELGILRSKSKSSDSLFVKLGGEGFETRVVDGILHVRAASAMLGYLNAPSPFDADGWLNTGDEVEFDETGEYMRIRGRRSEIINVGGEKVFPAEVESVLLQMSGVRDVAVTAQANPLTGQMVAARFSLAHDEALAALRARVREHCRGKLQPYKIPSKIEIAAADLHSDRFKKMRRSA